MGSINFFGINKARESKALYGWCEIFYTIQLKTDSVVMSVLSFVAYFPIN